VATPLKRAGVDAAFARIQWQHTVSCAALARRLIVDDDAAAEMAFTAGLLHDMGQVDLLHQHGAAYVQLHADAGDADVRILETERFGRPHDTLGAELMESWGLPAAIADAARHHHAPMPISGLSRVQQAVWVANRLGGTPAEAAQAATQSPDTLAPVKQAVADARAEIETLASLLNG
ncbi:MAG TPA: HDOD domain-containing protein, partial [Albitalea sp.]|nr:HDOD domain-containing protein [Albitalea sp.]